MRNVKIVAIEINCSDRKKIEFYKTHIFSSNLYHGKNTL